MSEKRVRIRILPLRGIGGIGGPGAEAWVTAEEAKRWVEGGYAKLATDEASVVSSSAARLGSIQPSELWPEPAGVEGDEHVVMKSKPRRR